MFARIMAVVLTVVLLVTGVLSAIGWMALKNQQTADVMETLRQEAREIAYLAAQQNRSSAGMPWSFGYFGSTSRQSDTAQAYLQWKARSVYEDYGAYILVVDRNGRIMDNKSTALAENPAFAAMINVEDINRALSQVLRGEEIELHVSAEGNDYFTVAVPFVQDAVVLGAVFMQTPAQVIEAGAEGLLAPVAGIAGLACLLAGTVLFLYLRGVLKPLNRLTAAATAMAEGDFAVRVPDTRATREVAELSAAFNTMTERLGAVEGSRREFVANVSHELRSPITAISGYVEGMLDGTIPPEGHERYLAIVSDETKRLSRLIGELLALSRLERDDAALDCTDFDVCDLLERVFLRRTGDLEARCMDVDCDFDPEPCIVRADMARIDQVIVNLVDNAIKFTPDGGCITLKVRAAEGLCTVTVADNGIGVLPEDRPKVFDRFFTADRAHTSGKGTGLGLSICQRIMDMHGQSISLLDTQEGAAFAFTLPLGRRNSERTGDPERVSVDSAD
ncbi:MAG: HAMP domain-containing histidine kinase [Clostridiales bacterium]|nr:HAMP domain-containing histidine kinase [Clostridiales bacterium]